MKQHTVILQVTVDRRRTGSVPELMINADKVRRIQFKSGAPKKPGLYWLRTTCQWDGTLQLWMKCKEVRHALIELLPGCATFQIIGDSRVIELDTGRRLDYCKFAGPLVPPT